jgi:uncharacterized membrane protein YraQ (UPF0718 family)
VRDVPEFAGVPAVGAAPSRRTAVLAGLVTLLLAAALLTWSKYLPYWLTVPTVLQSSDPGASILDVGGPASASPLAAGWSFTVAYLAGVWKALLAGLVVAAAVQVLLPRSWLRCAMGSPGARSGGLRGSLIGVLTLMCSCCAAPVAVALRRARAGLPASVGFWLGNPALNPVVIVLFLAVLPWQWGALRLVAGVVVVAVGIALARLEDRAPADGGGVGPAPAPFEGSLLVAYGRTLGGLAVRLLPEFLAVAFVLGAFRAELFPLGGTSGGTLVLVLALVVAGLLLPVPTGAEVAVVAGLLAAGLPVAAAAALAVTLPVFSLPSLLMVRNAFPSRLVLRLVGVAAGVGLVSAAVMPTLL